ncbi:trimeric intracellular cation channel family protein [Promicromonospora sukumoe]|uniref:Putative membrane protein YeiH n=1 Tax=Promicromonospora sukumoe TaxID=88382 RepID=A0A7W3J617_9MICO|nr:trimeric intracellular cation channel family protein [Promicromonospora sukumoe]MBA8806972.1 putative membrane protein YeiH [Promicromonospora sukumoe]
MVWAQLAGDLLGVFFFAVSGSLLAAQRQFDIVGSLLLGTCVGLGGGILRDVILDVGVPRAFNSPVYLLPPVLAAVVVYFFARVVHRFHDLLITFDAAGMALFAVTGTLVSLAAGMNPVASAILGLVTAVGGGVIRDVVANDVPQIFRARGLYAIPALLGAGLTSVLSWAGWFNLGTGAAIAVLVFVLRMVSLRYRWQAPPAGGNRAV